MQINLIKNSLWLNSTQMLIFLVMVVSVLFWQTWFTWVPSSNAWLARNRVFQIQNDDEKRLFDEIGVRLQIRYKSLKATSTNGSADVRDDTVRETEVPSSVANHTESNRDNICNSCELQKLLLALGLFICLIIVGIIIGIILNDKNNEASISTTISTTTLTTTSTTSTTTRDPSLGP